MSTDMITYLNFIAGLENATDQDLQNIIDERTNFIGLGSSNMMDNCDKAIDSVFDKIDDLAKKLEEEQIADDSVKLAEDAAAVAAIWSFGISMAAYAALAITDIALQADIKKKEKDLNDKLTSADKDIADQMGGVVSQYIDLTKKNNNFIKASSPAGLTPQTARSYLYNYMDFLSTHGGVDLANFKKYIEVARLSKDDANISKIYDILDEFTLSGDHGADAIKSALGKMNSALAGKIQTLEMIRGFTYAIWVWRMKISSNSLKQATEGVDGIPPEESEIGVFENMDMVGKAMAAITIVISIVDAFLNVYDIVETVKRYQENIKVFNKARQQYKDFYQHMHDASVKYKPPSKTRST